MRIGLDFDNTIVSYDELFHKVAFEGGLIPFEFPANKIAVRDYLRKTGRENIWTEMQGYVYGERMREAIPYPGMYEALISLKKQKIELILISHKTRFPYQGIQYDMHESAANWIVEKINHSNYELINNIIFCSTKEEKILNIDRQSCDVFLDDLPEILLSEQFPERAKRCLFDPGLNHKDLNNQLVTHHHSWSAFADWVFHVINSNE